MGERYTGEYSGSSLESTSTSQTNLGPATPVDVRQNNYSILRNNRTVVLLTLGVLGFILIMGLGVAIFNKPIDETKRGGSQSELYSVGPIPLTGLQVTPLELSQAESINFNGQLKVNAGFIITPSEAPTTSLPGQFYFDQDTKKPYYYNGTAYLPIGSEATQGVTSIGGFTGVVGLGNGLQLTNGQIRLTDAILQGSTAPGATGGLVSSVQGQTGDVSFNGGNGIAINGTTINNTGLLSLGGASGNLALGRGMVVQGGALRSTISLTSGSSNMVITDDGNGNYTIEDTSPGSGTGGVTLGPTVAQADNTGNTSINIDKTGAGNFLQLASNGVDQFVVDQSGTITTGSIAYAQVTGAPASTVTSFGGTSGAIALGSGLAIAGGTVSNSGVLSLSGTANQVAVSAATGAITISLPQAIATTSNPSFNSLTLSTALSPANGGTGVNGSAAANGRLLIGNGSGYTLANLTQGSGISITNGAGSISIAVDNTICTTAGNCAGAGTGVTTAGGTTGTIALFTGAQAIGDSILSQSGATITVAGTLVATNLQGNGSGISDLNASSLATGTIASGRVSGSYTGITGTGALAAGSIANGFGVISTGNNIITSASLQGNTLSVGGGSFAVNAAGAITAATGITSSGTITLSSLNSAGIVKNSAGGVLSTGSIALGTETTGNYIATLGTLTGLTTTGNTGAGSTPTISVTYGNGANTAAQGNTAFTFTPSGNLTGSLSGTAGGGFTTTTLAIVNNPTFSGLVTANGGLTVANATTLTNAGASLFSSVALGDLTTGAIGSAAATVDSATTFSISQTTAGQTLSLPAPTNLTAGRIVLINNVGAQSFTMQGVSINPGRSQQYVWNGTAWTSTNIDGAGSGVTSVVSDTNVTGSVAGNTLTLGFAGTLSAGRGGTGVDGSSAANGRILIGNGSGYTLANLTQGSGIAITNGAGAITIAVDSTICTTGGNCAGAGSGVTTAGGTTGTIALFTGAQAIGDSILSQSGATLTVAGTLAATNLQGNGSGLTNLDASALTTGTVGSARISGSYTGITGTGALAAGSITTGFGVISTGSNIITTAALQGNTLSIGGGAFAVNATGAITAATGITSSGTITFSSLNAAGIVKNSAGGVLSTGTVSLGSETTGNYIATLGTLTGLTTTGNTGAGSTPTLSVTYGTAANTAAQGNTAFTFTPSGNLTGSLSGTAGGGFTTTTLAIVNNPTFSGLITADGGLTVASNSNISQTGTGTFSTGTGAVSLNGNVTVAAGQSISFVGGITSTRPAAPTEGMLYYDTTTKQLLVYANAKWQADRSNSTVIVGTSAVGGVSGATASKNADGADFVNASTTSSQTVINSAIATLPASGGTVYLMEGTYIVDGSISLPNNVTLVGTGAGTIIKLKNAHNVNIKIITNTDVTTGTKVVVQNLQIDGNKANNTAGFQDGIYLNGMGGGTVFASREGAKLNDLTIHDLRSTGISISNSSYNKIFDNNINELFDYGIFATASSNNSIYNNNIQDANDGGIRLVNLSANNIISNNNSAGSGFGSGIALNNSSGNTITGNTSTENSYEGLYVGNASNGNTITGNTFQDNGNTGVDVYLSSKNTITGNNIGLNYYGVWLDATDESVVSSNNIYDNGGNSANEAILITGSNSNSISGNNISDSSCTTSCFAINITSATSSKNYLADNRFTDIDATATASIQDLGTGTVYANQSTGVDGANLVTRTANSATAFRVQNATGTALLTVDSSANKVVLAALDVTNATALASTLTVGGTTTLNGNTSVSGANTFTTGTGAVTLGALGAGVVQSSAAGLLSSGAIDRNSATLLSNDLSVANGGTGNDTYTNTGVLYYNGTNFVSTAASTGAQCLISTGAGVAPTWGSCTNGAAAGVDSVNGFTGVVAISGTANQVGVNNNAGTITLSTPQDINTTSAVTFGRVSVTTATNPGVGTALIFANNTNGSPTGNLADLQTGGTSRFAVSATGNVTATGSVTAVGVNGGTGLIQGTGGLTVSGTVTLGGLNSVGIVQTNASGVLSTSAVDRNSVTLFTGQTSVANGGTGSNTAAGARTNLGAATSGANSDITSLTGLTTALSVGQGGTGTNTLTANGILFGNGTAAVSATVAAANSILATNGSNVPGLTQFLPSAVQGNITATGALAAGSIASGFGTISTGNNITTTATIQGGTVTATGVLGGNSLSVNGGTFAVSSAGAITAATGITSSGSITFSALGAGVVKSSAGGLLSVGTVALGTDTTGNYVATLGTLTGLTTTGNTGAGSTPTLSVTYGSAANTAAQGNVSFTCPSGTGNLTGTGNAITIGAGGTCNSLTVVNNPTFSGLITADGGLTVASNSNFSQTGTGTLSTGTGNISLNGNVTVAAGQSISLVGGATGTRPAAPVEGMLYYDTTTKQLLVYANGKWQADRSNSTVIVAANNSKNKEGADYVVSSANETAGNADAQINAAISALPASGGSVYLMEGTYTIDNTISIPNNTTLTGAGDSTIIRLINAHVGSNFAMITNSDTTTGTGVIIQNLKIDGNKINQNNGSKYGISFSFMGSTARIGGKISSVTIQNTYLNPAVYLYGSVGNIVSNSTFYSNYGNIETAWTSGYNTISGNTFKAGGTDVFFLDSVGYNSVVNNTSIDGSNGYRIQSSNNTVTGNTIRNSSQYGLAIFSNDNVISGNRVSDNGSGGSNNGIYLSSGNRNTITSNYITDSSCTTTCYAIRISSGLVSNYLADNQHSGTTTNPSTIDDLGTNTIYANQTDGSGNLINRNQGGLTVGTTTTSTTLTLQGSLSASQLSTPSAPTLATVGTAGSTSRSYAVVASDGAGDTLASTAATIVTSNATLTGANYVTVSWTQVSGAVSYKIYRTATAGTPATTGLIGTVVGNVFSLNDTGLAGNAAATPVANTTGNASIAGFIQGGSLNITNNAVIGGTLAVTTLGATDSDAVMCRNTSNQLAACTNTFATTTSLAGYVQLQGTTPGTAQTGNLNITGTVIGSTINASTALQTSGTLAVTGASTFTGAVALNGGATVAAGQSISLVGGITSTRPASPTEGMLYYDSTTKQLLVYANGKWQADRSSSTVIVGTSAVGGTSGATASKGYDGADFVNTSTTSAQTTINAAIATLPATGGSVYLMEGTYVVDGPVSLPNNVAILGTGASTILKIRNGQSGYLTVITNSDFTTGTGVTIKDLTIDGNRANRVGVGERDGIYLDGMGAGVGSTARAGARISNVTVHSMFGGHGIYLYNSSNNIISSNTLRNMEFNGIYLEAGSHNNTITGNLSQGSTLGSAVNLEDSNDNTITGNTMQGNSYYGIFMIYSNGNTFTGNTTKSNYGGIDVVYSDNNTFSSNTIINNSYRSIYVDSSNNNIFTTNNVHDSGNTGFNEGIYVTAADSNSFIGNNISDSSCTTSCNAIDIVDATSDKNYLSNNRISDTDPGATAIIRDLGTGTVYANQMNSNGDIILKTASGRVGINTLAPTEVLNVYNGNLKVDYGNYMSSTVAAPGAPTVAVNATAGNLTGTKRYVVTFVTANGETNYGGFASVSAAVTPTAQQVDITNIPTGLNGVVTQRKIYRGTSNGGPFKLVTTIADNTTTTYTDNIDDASLGADVTKTNTTGGLYVVDGQRLINISTVGSIANAFVGLQSGISNTTGGHNTAFGNYTLNLNTTGYANTASGSFALQANTTGYENTASGNNALQASTTAIYQTATGSNSLYNTTTGGYNTATGAYSLYNNTTGYANTATGTFAFNNNTTGYQNTGLGGNAGFANTTGFNNTYVGYNAGQTSTATIQNATAIGYNAQVTASNSIVLGGTGADAVNVGIGLTAPAATLDVRGTLQVRSDTESPLKGADLMTATHSLTATAGWTAISGTGQSAQATHNGAISDTTPLYPNPNFSLTSGQIYEVTFSVTGRTAGFVCPRIGTAYIGSCFSTGTTLKFTAATTGLFNFYPYDYDGGLFDGTVSAISVKPYTMATTAPTLVVKNFNDVNAFELRVTSELTNTTLGLNAGMNNVIGTGLTAFGSYALQSNTTGRGNVAVGTSALQNSTRASSNVAIGFESMKATTTGNGNVSIGYQAMLDHTTGRDNVAIGTYALENSISTSENVAIGPYALNSAVSSGDNIAIGYSALSESVSNYSNTAIGPYALMNAISNENTAVGYSALQRATTGGFNNAIGSFALENNTTGSDNLAFGYEAGTSNTTGNNNTFLGNYAGSLSSSNLTNSTAIGYNAQVTASNSIVLGGTGVDAVSVGIGTTAPASTLHVAGTTNFEVTAALGAASTAHVINASNGANNASSLVLDVRSGGTSRLAVNALTGYVGIGTSNLTDNLVVSATTGYNGIVIDRTSATDKGTELTFSQQGTATFSLGVDPNLDNSNDFYIYDELAGATRFMVLSNGNVGVQKTLTIDDEGTSTCTTTNFQSCLGLRFGTQTSGEGIASNRTGANNLSGLDFYTNNNARLSITNGGNVGIGRNNPSYLLHVGSSAITTGTAVARFENAGGTCTVTPSTAGGVICTSDSRFKKNIVDYQGSALDKILGTSVVSYNLNAESDGAQLHTGFIAQDLQQSFPDLVQTDAEGFLAVSYAGLTPYLAKAIQEQQTTINVLSGNLNATNIKVNDLLNGNANIQVNNLAVAGTAQLQNLTVTGSASFNGTLVARIAEITTDLTIGGKIVSRGTAPQLTVGVGAGTSLPNQTAPEAVVEGTDSAGSIIISSGATITEIGVLAELQFNQGYAVGTTFKVALTPTNGSALDIRVFVEKTASGFRIVSRDKLAPNSSYSFDYIVLGAQQVAATAN